VVVVANFVYAFFLTFPNIWLKWWTEGYGDGHMVKYLVGYVLLSVGTSLAHATVIYVSKYKQLASPGITQALFTIERF